MTAADRHEVNKLDDLLGANLGRRHGFTPGGGASVDPATVETDLAAVLSNGYVIWENLLGPGECDGIREQVTPLLDDTGRNNFEGHRTQRLYSVLAKTRSCDRLVDHPRALALLDRLLMTNYLLSALQVINILPGESAQMLHFDDAIYPLPRPRPAVGAATIWAIDDFTADNGATVVVDGSHRWGDRRPGPGDAAVPVVMPAGSCVFFLGTLWHGGGANRSGSGRLAVTAQYCQPWLRPLEAFTLSVPRDTARTLSDDIKRLIGYSIHAPFVGAVDGMHPLRLLQS